MYLSLSEHDDVYMNTETSPYGIAPVHRTVENVDYSNGVNFDDVSKYFKKQGFNDNQRRRDAVLNYQSQVAEENSKKLNLEKEHIRRLQIMEEQAKALMTPVNPSLELAVRQSSRELQDTGNMGTINNTMIADFNRLDIVPDEENTMSVTSYDSPHSTDYETFTCGPAIGRKRGTPVQQMGFFNLDEIVERGEDFLEAEYRCRVFGENCPKDSSGTPTQTPTQPQPTQQTQSGFKMSPLAWGGVALGALAIGVLVFKK